MNNNKIYSVNGYLVNVGKGYTLAESVYGYTKNKKEAYIIAYKAINLTNKKEKEGINDFERAYIYNLDTMKEIDMIINYRSLSSNNPLSFKARISKLQAEKTN